MNEQAQGFADDEISLVEIWQVLFRRKWLVMSAVVLTLAGAGIYLQYAQPVYESEAAVYVGELSGGQLLESPSYLVTRLQSEYGEAAPAWVAKVVSDRKDARLIQIKVQGHSANAAHGLALRLVEEVTKAHEAAFERAAQQLKTETAAISRLVSEGERQLSLAEKAAGPSAQSQAALITAKMNLASELAALQRRAAEIEHASLFSRKSEVMKQPIVPAEPVRPRPKLVFGLAVFMGLLMGAVAAFMANFIHGMRRQQASVPG